MINQYVKANPYPGKQFHESTYVKVLELSDFIDLVRIETLIWIQKRVLSANTQNVVKLCMRYEEYYSFLVTIYQKIKLFP